jgi:hypothetical protein
VWTIHNMIDTIHKTICDIIDLIHHTMYKNCMIGTFLFVG